MLLLLAAVAIGAVVWRRASDQSVSDAESGRIVKRSTAGSGEVVELLSAPHVLDRRYRSMQGPSRLQRGITLLAAERPRAAVDHGCA